MKPLMATLVALVLAAVWLLGPSNVTAWFEHKGQKLNPDQQVHVYRSAGSRPTVLPNVQIGTWSTFTFKGAVQVNTAPNGTRCIYSSAKVLISDNAFGVYGSQDIDTVTVLMIPAGDPCPDRAPRRTPEDSNFKI